ncbi:TetR/AcrR family transcriptional regulator [uncultured Jatrophihabitans sp.]|uniref:TetR/AcrR family transcriptional regulator n=1 Tax=uncultured Jatrophihabitans sp. TaxID=1610747 RepID=UPI0035CC2C05
MTATETRRGRPRSEAIDAAILDATVDELVDHGRNGLSMERVADRAGVAKTTVYRRYPDADEMIVAALRGMKGGPPTMPDAGVRDQLVALLDSMRQTWSEPRFAAVMRRVAADGTTAPEAYAEHRERLVGPHIARFREVLEQGVVQGLIRGDVDLEWVRTMIVAPVTATTMTLRPAMTAAQVETTVDTVLRGVAP